MELARSANYVIGMMKAAYMHWKILKHYKIKANDTVFTRV